MSATYHKIRRRSDRLFYESGNHFGADGRHFEGGAKFTSILRQMEERFDFEELDVETYVLTLSDIKSAADYLSTKPTTLAPVVTYKFGCGCEHRSRHEMGWCPIHYRNRAGENNGTPTTVG
jgi:hypothetical protein